MLIVDPKGLFEGERLAACSDAAQLHWQRLFLAANGYARLELSYSVIISTIYRTFNNPPTENELWGFFEEYAENYLAVLYQVDGVWWAQFDTSEKYMPRFKTARDKNSPSAPVELLDRHRSGYQNWKKSKSVQNQRFQKFTENFGSVPKVSAAVVVAVVGAVAEVEDKNLPSAPQTRPPASQADTSVAALVDDSAMKAGIDRLFDYYCEKLNRDPRRYTLTSARRTKARSRLLEREKLSDLEGAIHEANQCIDNLASSAYHRQGHFIDWTEQIFKSAEEFEKRLNWQPPNGANNGSRGAAVGRVQRSLDAWDRVEAERRAERALDSPTPLVTASSVAQGVLDGCSLSGNSLFEVIEKIAAAESRIASYDPAALQSEMIAAWREFQAAGSKLTQYAPRPVPFFGEGYWRNKSRWGWREGMEPTPRVYINTAAEKVQAQISASQ